MIYLLLLSSCGNSEADLVDFDLDYQGAETTIDRERQKIHIAFPDSTRVANALVANFTLSEGASASVESGPLQSGLTTQDYESPFTFRIESEDGNAVQEWGVYTTNEDYISEWGFGGFLSYERSLNRDYEWYIDQSQTGTFSAVNCAPSSMIMAGRWSSENFTYTIDDVRKWINSSGGGYSSLEIDACLDMLGLDHGILDLGDRYEDTRQLMSEQIDSGHVLILCLDVHYLILDEDPAHHVGKYYRTLYLGVGHCIVVKGYKIVDGNYFFEVYDPAGYNFKYQDGSYKGKDRYYPAIDLYTSAFSYWNHAFVVRGAAGP